MICFFSSRIVSRSKVWVRTIALAKTFSASTAVRPRAASTTRSMYVASLSASCWVAGGALRRRLRAICSISCRLGRSQSTIAETLFSSSGGILVTGDSTSRLFLVLRSSVAASRRRRTTAGSLRNGWKSRSTYSARPSPRMTWSMAFIGSLTSRVPWPLASTLKPSVIDHTSSRISRSTHSFLSDSSTRVSSGEVTQMSE